MIKHPSDEDMNSSLLINFKFESILQKKRSGIEVNCFFCCNLPILLKLVNSV